jgi:hypothetical protein
MYGDIHLVDKSLIDGRALNAWGKLDGESSPNLSVGILGPRPIHRLTYKSTRRVRRTLADGTVKIYVYPGTKDTSTDNADIVAALAM